MRGASSGWTWQTFLLWAFGTRELAPLAARAAQVRRWAAQLGDAANESVVRYELRCTLRDIRAGSDRHFWYEEADLAHMLEIVMARGPLAPGDRGRLTAACERLEELVLERVATIAALAA